MIMRRLIENGEEIEECALGGWNWYIDCGNMDTKKYGSLGVNLTKTWLILFSKKSSFL